MFIEALGLCQMCRSSTYGSFRKIQMDQHCMLCLEFHGVSLEIIHGLTMWG